MRLCANTGAVLHLIKPLGFDLDNTKLRRAGLDYREFVTVQVHDSLEAFQRDVKPVRLFACSKFGRCTYSTVSFQAGDALLFGSETDGLPLSIRNTLPEDHVLYIPMAPDNRSLNLANAVAVILYEAWRQNNFSGAAGFHQ